MEILERAEARLEEEEEQKWLVEHNRRSVEGARRDITRLRGEIYLRQEQWKESHDELVAKRSRFWESLWARFNESAINYLWMLGRSAEGIGEWEKARCYYADAHFAPTPHTEARTGLERVHHQMGKGKPLIRLRSFSRTPKLNTGFEKMLTAKKIRQNFIANKLNKEATDFR